MKKMLRSQDNVVENALKNSVPTKTLKEKKLPLRLERQLRKLNARSAPVKWIQMELQKRNANQLVNSHGIQMATCVKHANVSLVQKESRKKNAKRRNVANATTVKRVYRSQDNAVENAFQQCVLIRTRTEKMSLLRSERHGIHLNVKSAIVKKLLMEVPKPIVNQQERIHGIQMATYVRSASVTAKRRNVWRQLARNARMMKRMFPFQVNAAENALKKFVLTRMPTEKMLLLSLVRNGNHLIARHASVLWKVVRLRLNVTPKYANLAKRDSLLFQLKANAVHSVLNLCAQKQWT